MAKVTVLDPRGYAPKITARGLAPQLDGLDGKTVYLVDVGLEELRRLHAPDAGLARRARAAASGPRSCAGADQHEPDPELCERIRHDGDAAILGVGL